MEFLLYFDELEDVKVSEDQTENLCGPPKTDEAVLPELSNIFGPRGTTLRAMRQRSSLRHPSKLSEQYRTSTSGKSEEEEDLGPSPDIVGDEDGVVCNIFDISQDLHSL